MLRVVVLVKQVPKAEAMALDDKGRLRRDGVELEINAYCRRAVSKGVELVREHGGECIVLTLGPPSAADALREALAWGADRAILVSDPALAGSDTLATARAVTSAMRRLGDIDLVLTGRNSVDADTGQVAPEVAELLGLPFIGGARHITLDGDRLAARCEHDDGWSEREVQLPAVVSCAERLCDPAKVKPHVWSGVPDERVERLSTADLGDGPWGQAGSPTRVGEIRIHEVDRMRRMLVGPVEDQVTELMRILDQRQALCDSDAIADRPRVPAAPEDASRMIAVVLEPGREAVAEELLGAAAELAGDAAARVVALDAGSADPAWLARCGADRVIRLVGSAVEEDVAATIADWCAAQPPWAVLFSATMWGREVAARTAARLGAGLTGDVIELSRAGDRLVGWKPAFGGRLVAAIRSTSPVQLVTVRPGVLPTFAPRDPVAPTVDEVAVAARSRLRIGAARRDDDLEVLARAPAVIGVGSGVEPEEYDLLEPLRAALGAELAGTRKVTDRGWLPRDRQVGLTGRAIAPRLYVAIGLSGKFNHSVGIRQAGTVVAINRDPDAFVFDHADVGLVADWRDVVRPLAAASARARGLELDPAR
ncbi:MAG TPA: FAD-binding protein [Mycobacteriales bacterium]|nr:FAD-binding protein [Mycobacteriales bacterium]